MDNDTASSNRSQGTNSTGTNSNGSNNHRNTSYQQQPTASVAAPTPQSQQPVYSPAADSRLPPTHHSSTASLLANLSPTALLTLQLQLQQQQQQQQGNDQRTMHQQQSMQSPILQQQPQLFQQQQSFFQPQQPQVQQPQQQLQQPPGGAATHLAQNCQAALLQSAYQQLQMVALLNQQQQQQPAALHTLNAASNTSANEAQLAAAPAAPMGPTVEPRTDDVLFGRGQPTRDHPGNRKMRQCLATYGDRYRAAKDREEKTGLTLQMVAEMKQSGTRFLRQNGSGGWICVSDAEARRKLSHAMRDSLSRTQAAPEPSSSKRPPKKRKTSK